MVDDEHDAANMLAEGLGTADREVRTAYDWVTALETYFQFMPHVCLLDIGMAGLDGYYIARAICATNGPKPLLIAVTARTGQIEVARSLNAGFHHHVSKPAYLSDIEKLIAGAPLANVGDTSHH